MGLGGRAFWWGRLRVCGRRLFWRRFRRGRVWMSGRSLDGLFCRLCARVLLSLGIGACCHSHAGMDAAHGRHCHHRGFFSVCRGFLVLLLMRRRRLRLLAALGLDWRVPSLTTCLFNLLMLITVLRANVDTYSQVLLSSVPNPHRALCTLTIRGSSTANVRSDGVRL